MNFKKNSEKTTALHWCMWPNEFCIILTYLFTFTSKFLETVTHKFFKNYFLNYCQNITHGWTLTHVQISAISHFFISFYELRKDKGSNIILSGTKNNIYINSFRGKREKICSRVKYNNLQGRTNSKMVNPAL